MNIDLTPNVGIPNMYDNIYNRLGNENPYVLILITVVIIFYYLLFSNLGIGQGPSPGMSRMSNLLGQGPSSSPSSQYSQGVSSGLSFIEIILWGLFIFLLLINGLQYFFKIDIKAAIKNIFSPQPEVDIQISSDEPDMPYDVPVPEIMFEKQVYHIPDNQYTYEEAKALCRAYGSRLATYDEIESAYNNGAEWCGYGWSDGQMALFPTQKDTYAHLQGIEGHKNDCGRPGVNGGYIANPNARFGVNCYGYKPEITEAERNAMDTSSPYPVTMKDKRMERLVEHYRKKLPDIMISPFNNNNWSKI
jgi:hypothetical protein